MSEPKIIKVRVKNRIATCTENRILTAVNTGDVVQFEFDEEWEPNSPTATRTARFFYDGAYIDIPFNGDVCPLPSFNKKGNIYIGVFWKNIFSTTHANIELIDSSTTPGRFPENPPDDVYNQIITLMNEKINSEQLESEVKNAVSELQEDLAGTDGQSAYEIARANGFEGTEAEWLESLKGEKGEQGPQGAPGRSVGIESIGYEIEDPNYPDNVVETTIDFTDGSSITIKNGKSAYRIAVDNGFEGTESEWLESLKGEKGEKGAQGEQGDDGYTPIKGTDYYTEAEKTEIISELSKQLGSLTLTGVDENGQSHTWTIYGLSEGESV